MMLPIGIAIGAAAGTMAGVLGIGGGILIPPLLAVCLGLSQHTAQAVSLAALLPPVGYPALIGYRRQGFVPPWRLVRWLVVGFAVAGAMGGIVVQYVPDKPLRIAFVGVLLAVVIRTISSNRKSVTSEAMTAVPLARTGIWPGLAVGGIGGLVSGMFGIGGGVIILPLLVGWARLDRLTAQVSTLAMMLAPIGLPAVIAYGVANPLPWPLLVAVALGFVIGAAIGGRIGPRVSHKVASYLFAAVVAMSAIVMLLK